MHSYEVRDGRDGTWLLPIHGGETHGGRTGRSTSEPGNMDTPTGIHRCCLAGAIGGETNERRLWVELSRPRRRQEAGQSKQNCPYKGSIDTHCFFFLEKHYRFGMDAGG